MKANNVSSLKPGKNINDAYTGARVRRSRFDNSHVLAQTMRFGEYTPHFVANGVPSDFHRLLCNQSTRTYTLKAPLMQAINMKRDYFAVPMESILPRNWEKVFMQPNIGDDVPEEVDCAVVHKSNGFGFFGLVCSLLSSFSKFYEKDASAAYVFTDVERLQAYMKFVLLVEYFFSSGSLLNYLGLGVDANFRYTDSTGKVWSADELIDFFWDTVFSDHMFTEAGIRANKSVIFSVFNDLKSWRVCATDVDLYNPTYRGSDLSSFVVCSPHGILEFLRENPSFVMGAMPLGTLDISSLMSGLDAFFESLIPALTDCIVDIELPIDISRLWAYQMICHHFYSNDRVDFIYTAELFREAVHTIYDNLTSTGGPDVYNQVFSYNGIRCEYDYLSAFYFRFIVETTVLELAGLSSGDQFTSLDYFAYLLSFRRSLRFVDYFTGSKTRPLAVGDTSVDVDNDKVDVVDITRNIQVQRFLNAVNRAGRKSWNYLKGVFNTIPDTDYHNPLYLGHTSDIVYGQEIQNTGENQFELPQSSTSIGKSNSSKYCFEFNWDKQTDCIIMGITYFDIPRLYWSSTDRDFFHKDRYDRFIPQMEYVGDQPVYRAELLLPESGNFGYTTRYMEFKQRISRAVGGFVRNLPGYAFLADLGGQKVVSDLSPDYIRSSNCDLDYFYVALTGYSLASYFHFIVVNNNQLVSDRPMSVAPNIL